MGAVGPLVVGEMIYAEVSARYTHIEALERALPAGYFQREHTPWPAAFPAGKASADYKRRGGRRRSPLPDFFIGAHTAVAGLKLPTRDPARFRTCFLTAEPIAPE
jgi:hypothetical protein